MNSNSFYIKNQAIITPKNKKLTLKLGIQTYQILTNDDEVCIPSLSSFLLAALDKEFFPIVNLKTSSFIAFWTELLTGMGVPAYWRGAEG